MYHSETWITLFCFLIFTLLTSFDCSLRSFPIPLPLANSTSSSPNANLVLWVLLLISCIINLTFSLLIAIHIRQYQNFIKKALGVAHSSIYTRIIVICVESCALISVCEGVYVVAAQVDSVAASPMLELLPHVCVSLTFCLIYSVAGARNRIFFSCTILT
ncbi:hypothetical protein CPB84DRAFT_1295108 [Gymnopilus junonius]|uniref:Uncharacterized protein n=1 Tax=Gymnopilus junonius TaxID=109634 RepID=A0A9P5NK52_GYMJU|nr:hypothetical protein CPB84DRAFT_1295108 [Gymnopilus junonius]